MSRNVSRKSQNAVYKTEMVKVCFAFRCRRGRKTQPVGRIWTRLFRRVQSDWSWSIEGHRWHGGHLVWDYRFSLQSGGPTCWRPCRWSEDHFKGREDLWAGWRVMMRWVERLSEAPPSTVWQNDWNALLNSLDARQHKPWKRGLTPRQVDSTLMYK